MKAILYKALIIPDAECKHYMRKAVVRSKDEIITTRLYFIIRLMPLQLAKKWGNQHHKELIKAERPSQDKPYYLNVFEIHMPFLFLLIKQELNKYLMNDHIISTEPLDLNIAVPGRLVTVDLGKEVYRMMRLPDGKLVPATIETINKETKEVTKSKIIMRDMKIFLYGNEVDNADAIIELKKQEMLNIAAPVKSIDSLE